MRPGGKGSHARRAAPRPLAKLVPMRQRGTGAQGSDPAIPLGPREKVIAHGTRVDGDSVVATAAAIYLPQPSAPHRRIPYDSVLKATFDNDTSVLTVWEPGLPGGL